ncbi:uncharacterized protein BDV14DRAFT_94321 [Aspergillus stella-maris]|uniref:uncharacterized protein n=1 Tax=Aspergillus stella-maris TaxID=1810926 RepID=UPI003CCC914A
MTQLLEHPPELRVECMWRMIKGTSTEILMHLTTITARGLNWAPKTLLLSESNTIPGSMPYNGVSVRRDDLAWSLASVKPEGLLFRCSALVFNIGPARLGAPFFMKASDKTHCIILPDPETSSRSEIFKIMRGLNRPRRQDALLVNPYQTYGSTRAAFMGMQPLPERDEIRHTGILIAITDERDGILYGKRLCLAFARQVPPGEMAMKSYCDERFPDEVVAHLHENQAGSGTDDELVVTHTFGRRTSDDQLWCID